MKFYAAALSVTTLVAVCLYTYRSEQKDCPNNILIPSSPIDGLSVASIDFDYIDGRKAEEALRNSQRVWYYLDAGLASWGLPTNDSVKIVIFTPEEEWDYRSASFRGEIVERNLEFEELFCEETGCNIVWAESQDNFASRSRKTGSIEAFENAFSYSETFTLVSDERMLTVYTTSSIDPVRATCLMNETIHRIIGLGQ